MAPSAKLASCTVEAVSDVEACYFPYTDFVIFLEECPTLKSRLLTMADAVIRMQREHLLILGRKNPSEKLASFFLILAQRQGFVGQKRMLVDLPMTQHDIADYLGLTPETVSRTTSKFRELGLIDCVHNNRTILLRPTMLEDLANLSSLPEDQLALSF